VGQRRAGARGGAQRAEVKGLERRLERIALGDATLGGKRPEAVAAIVGAVQAKLDAARQLQLARDKFALRAPVLREYRLAIRTPIDLFVQLRPALEAVKSLSGSTPEALALMQNNVTRILALASAIVPP